MFRPVNDKHSIQEVHFVLETEQHWIQEDKAVIEQGYGLWGETLPRKLEAQQIVVQMGPQLQGGGIENPPPLMPLLTYGSVDRDGSREWELAFDGRFLRITCGKYSRWRQVWKVARKLFQMVGQTLNGRETGVRAMELTYQDLFVWEGQRSEYNVRELLTDEHGTLGSRILNHGPLWHCHNGWMKEQSKWADEPYLERIHLDGCEGEIRQEKKLWVAITTTVRLGHGGTKRLFTLQRGFNELHVVGEKREGAVERFEWLHEKNKELFREVLEDEMQRTIGL